MARSILGSDGCLDLLAPSLRSASELDETWGDADVVDVGGCETCCPGSAPMPCDRGDSIDGWLMCDCGHSEWGQEGWEPGF